VESGPVSTGPFAIVAMMDCAFCGRKMNGMKGRKRSKEHAFASWLLDEVAPPGKVTHTVSASREGPIRRQRTPDELDVVTRKVCVPCNAGWMNDLENAARPYLQSMFRRHGRTYYGTGCQLLAAWAAKTALAMELANPDPKWRRPIEDVHYRAMAAGRDHPPPRTLVWLGAYRGHRHLSHWSKDIQIKSETGNETHGYDATIIVSPVVLQVFGHLSAEELAVEKKGYRAEMARQIWPYVEPVAWPPPRVMGEDDLWAFMRSFEEVPKEEWIYARCRAA
jgi:hypothetical protein